VKSGSLSGGRGPARALNLKDCPIKNMYSVIEHMCFTVFTYSFPVSFGCDILQALLIAREPVLTLLMRLPEHREDTARMAESCHRITGTPPRPWQRPLRPARRISGYPCSENRHCSSRTVPGVLPRTAPAQPCRLRKPFATAS